MKKVFISTLSVLVLGSFALGVTNARAEGTKPASDTCCPGKCEDQKADPKSNTPPPTNDPNKKATPPTKTNLNGDNPS